MFNEESFLKSVITMLCIKNVDLLGEKGDSAKNDVEYQRLVVEEKALPAFAACVYSTLKAFNYKIDLKKISPADLKQSIAETLTIDLTDEQFDTKGQLNFNNLSKGIVTLESSAIDQSFVRNITFSPMYANSILKINTDFVKASEAGITTINAPFVDQFSSDKRDMTFSDRYQFPAVNAKLDYYSNDSFRTISNESPLSVVRLQQENNLTADGIKNLFSSNCVDPDIEMALPFEPKMLPAREYYPAVLLELHNALERGYNQEKTR